MIATLVRSIFEQPDRDTTWSQLGDVVSVHNPLARVMVHRRERIGALRDGTPTYIWEIDSGIHRIGAFRGALSATPANLEWTEVDEHGRRTVWDQNYFDGLAVRYHPDTDPNHVALEQLLLARKQFGLVPANLPLLVFEAHYRAELALRDRREGVLVLDLREPELLRVRGARRVEGGQRLRGGVRACGPRVGRRLTRRRRSRGLERFRLLRRALTRGRRELRVHGRLGRDRHDPHDDVHDVGDHLPPPQRRHHEPEHERGRDVHEDAVGQVDVHEPCLPERQELAVADHQTHGPGDRDRLDQRRRLLEHTPRDGKLRVGNGRDVGEPPILETYCRKPDAGKVLCRAFA